MTGQGAKPRIAIGALMHESNAFAPLPMELADFRKSYYEVGPAVVENLRGSRIEMAGAIDVLEREGVEIVPLLATGGMPGGVVSRACYSVLRGTLLGALEDAGPVDGVYLATHGAMLSEGLFDVESDLLEGVRKIVRGIPIAISCDMHANVTPRMMALSDIIIGYQLYPHDDTFETGQRAAGLLVRQIRGEVRPVMRMRKAPMQVPGVNQVTSGSGPMADFNRAARAREARGEALVINYFCAFSKLDAPDTGWRSVVITDDDPEAGDRIALQMVREAWRRRHEFDVPLTAPAHAIAAGLRSVGRPIVLVDSADCVGGGAAGDSAVVLRALIAAGVDEPAVILINDAETVRAAQDAGSGGVFDARIGNKITPLYGSPVEARVTVAKLFDGRFTYVGGPWNGVASDMGPSALLEAGSLRIICCSLSSYEYGDEQFRAAGLDVSGYKFIVTKTVGNFKKAFDYAAAAYVLDTPGPQTPNQKALPWKHVTRPLYPLDDDFEPDFESYPPLE